MLLTGNQASPRGAKKKADGQCLEQGCRGCQGGWASTSLSMQIQGSNLHRENVITQIGTGPGPQGLDWGGAGKREEGRE